MPELADLRRYFASREFLDRVSEYERKLGSSGICPGRSVAYVHRLVEHLDEWTPPPPPRKLRRRSLPTAPVGQLRGIFEQEAQH